MISGSVLSTNLAKAQEKYNCICQLIGITFHRFPLANHLAAKFQVLQSHSSGNNTSFQFQSVLLVLNKRTDLPFSIYALLFQPHRGIGMQALMVAVLSSATLQYQQLATIAAFRLCR